MSTSFLSLSSGSRISNYLGLKMDEGKSYKHSGVMERQYAYIEVPVRHLENLSTGEQTMKGLRNQVVCVVPACTVSVKGSYRFEVHPDREMWQFGTVQGMYYLEPKEGEITPSFVVHLRKDMEVMEDQMVIRIYMRD